MRNRTFLSLFLFFSSFLWFYSFSNSILPLHIYQQGITFQDQIFGQIVRFIAELIILAVVVSLSSRISWRIALILFLTYFLLSIKIISPLQFYLASALNGIGVFFFYIFYNTAHFENTPKENTGHSSALMYSLPTFIGVAAPLAAGITKTVVPDALWLLSGVFFIVSFLLINKQKNFRIDFSFLKALQEIKATRRFVFIEGVWESLIFGFIPVYTLFFIKTPLQYGLYLSYLSLVGAGANLVFGRMTDKIQKRAVFLYPITILMAIVTFLFAGAVQNITLWIVVTGIIQMMLPLFWNATTTLVVDAHANLRLAIPGREICLAAGKTIGMMIIFLSFTFEKTPHLLFFILGGVMLLFPLHLYWRTLVRKSHRYY
ncbi:hypothetical protein HY358_01555 [Candidatus Roizmanbacteria bacterium]|nr:hypothetical protein [Candidatus Roizmanbacteria bacterium]